MSDQKNEDSDENVIIMIGNPGSGKSSILNYLINTVRFKSGVSSIEGLTKILQREKIGNLVYYDSPGLLDLTKKKEAGEELNKLFKKVRRFKLYFVVNYNSGRLLFQDLMTVELVLKSFSHPVNFSLIVNKADVRLSTESERRYNEEESVGLQCLEATKHNPDKVFFITTDQLAQDRDNVMLQKTRFLDKLKKYTLRLNFNTDVMFDLKTQIFDLMKNLHEVMEHQEKKIQEILTRVAKMRSIDVPERLQLRRWVQYKDNGKLHSTQCWPSRAMIQKGAVGRIVTNYLMKDLCFHCVEDLSR